MLYLLLQAVYFILPGYVANMLPAAFSKSRFLYKLAKPVDRGLTFRGQPLFGEHKTYRGFVVGVGGAIITVWLQKLFLSVDFFKDLSLIDYSAVSVWWLGALFGFGTLFGDMLKSFFKRRLSIASGKSWLPFDQIDHAVGALALVCLVYIPSWELAVIVITHY